MQPEPEGPAVEFRRDRLRVVVLNDRAEMGCEAAAHVGRRLMGLLAERPRARAVFAAAPSQQEFLAALAGVRGIDWSRLDVFQLDEYVGFERGHPRSFGAWLDDHIWSSVRPGRIQKMDGANPAGSAAEIERYSALLMDGIDIAFLGVGENGHLAFNDPHVADFSDPASVKLVEIDDTSRRQQVTDGAFERIEDVPRLAISLTMSTILHCRTASVVVPGRQKAAAIAAMLEGPVTTACPASALRRHPDAIMFLDREAASGLSLAALPMAPHVR